MKKNLVILMLIPPIFFLVGCNGLHKLTGTTSPMNDDTLPDIQTVRGVSSSDFPLIGGVRTEGSAISVRVLKNGIWISLNQYEFVVVNSGVQMGHEVTVSGNQLSYVTPFIPVAPTGTSYEITSILNH